LKNVHVRAGACEAEGELMVTHYGLEGGAIYLLGPVLRAMSTPEVRIDFKPRQSQAELVGKLVPAQRVSLIEAARRWHLSPTAVAILRHEAKVPALAEVRSLAAVVKNCAIRLVRPRPLAEAISSAGGIRWSELTESLMLRRLPGIFAAGEMIDWEAPTGGYLIQGCFATGTRAGLGAAAWLKTPAQSEGC
jgi:predicted flavoprotein YhiN